MPRRLLLRLGLGALLAAMGAASCLSPTIPLPPPEVDTISLSAEPGIWFVSGTCAEGALVTVLNDETGEGVVVEDRDLDGRWFISFAAEECDLAWAKQERGSDSSSRNTFVVEAISPNGPVGTSNCQ